jgi:hypothetical protein
MKTKMVTIAVMVETKNTIKVEHQSITDKIHVKVVDRMRMKETLEAVLIKIIIRIIVIRIIVIKNQWLDH